jgi:hypothetical protein
MHVRGVRGVLLVDDDVLFLARAHASFAALGIDTLQSYAHRDAVEQPKQRRLLTVLPGGKVGGGPAS